MCKPGRAGFHPAGRFSIGLSKCRRISSRPTILIVWLVTARVLAGAPAAVKLGEALIDAARSDDRAAVAALLEQAADVNAREGDGTTALAWAATRTNTDIAELLLKAGANPDLTNELGIGPLSLAITNGSTAMVKLLIGKGADPNVRGRTVRRH
jgi:hypothetical protein